MDLTGVIVMRSGATRAWGGIVSVKTTPFAPVVVSVPPLGPIESFTAFTGSTTSGAGADTVT